MTMSKIVKKLGILIFLLAIVILLMPLSQVQGQFVSSSTSVSSNKVQELSEVVNEQTLMTPTMVKAWEEYQMALETLTFQNIQTSEWNGDTIETVTEKFNASVTPVEHTLQGAEHFQFLLYTYEESAQETAQASGLDMIEIGFVFVDGHLIFGALSNLVTDFSDENLISTADADQLKLENTSLSDIAAINPRIKAVAHMLVDGSPKDVIVMDSGSDFSDGVTHFYFIEEGVVTHHEELDIFTAMQGTQTIIFDFMAFHYADGIVGELTSSDSPGEDLIDSTNLAQLDPLNKLITDTQINNEQLLYAWEGYLQAIDQLEFRDLASEDLIGSLIEDVETSFDIGIVPERLDAPNGVLSLLFYEFTEKENRPFNTSEAAELTLYFVDDLLAFAGVVNLTNGATEERLLTAEQIKNIASGTTLVQELVEANPLVLGVGYMVQSQQPRSVVALLSGDSVSNAIVNFLYIREDVIRGIDSIPFEEASTNLPIDMFYNLGDFFNAEASEIQENESVEKE